MPRIYGFSEYGGTDQQDFFEQDTPTPMAGEILVEVRAAGVNPVDWKIREGALREFLPLSLPVALGVEVAGLVRAVGQDVEGFADGDEVFGYVAPGSGGYAEYTLTSVATTAHNPPQLSYADASTIPVAGATAYDGVAQLGLTEGQTMLINGVSGGVGVAAAQIARDRGIAVIGTASEDKRALIESLGAILVPYGDGVADRVRELMPQGVDAIFDLAGGDGLRAVADLVADKAKLISAGDGATVEELGGQLIERDRSPRVLNLVATMMVEGKLDPHVEDTLSLDQAAEALAAVEVGHAKGKVVIEVG